MQALPHIFRHCQLGCRQVINIKNYSITVVQHLIIHYQMLQTQLCDLEK